jgi:hypothetical protein
MTRAIKHNPNPAKPNSKPNLNPSVNIARAVAPELHAAFGYQAVAAWVWAKPNPIEYALGCFECMRLYGSTLWRSQ